MDWLTVIFKETHNLFYFKVHDYSEIYTPSTAEAKAVIATAASEAADYYGTSTASMSASEQSSRSMEARTDSRLSAHGSADARWDILHDFVSKL